MKNTHPGNRRPKRKFAVCQKSGKRRYRDQRDAKLALEQARRLRAIAEINGVQCTWTVRRLYDCDRCGGVHLTSQAA